MTGDAQEIPQGWVPVEHRFLGLDRRTFTPALVALAAALVLIYGLPALNSAIPWHNEVKAGDVLDLGAGATAVPPVGWQLESGTLTGTAASASPTALQITLATGGATIDLRGASYTGSADAFLDQVDRSEGDAPGLDGARGTITTAAGLTGVVQASTGPAGDVLDVAFKVGQPADTAPALLVRVRTAPDQFERYRDEVTAFLRGITPGAAR
ncbi:hypothetical protein [Amycolatopsis thailandensis]|uniref:Uncharacterized protein n=1 Tax=Amycolatopsis thailandensis TaxID=589330 RepID=A0A229S438_9PSEU|nr:hypothetical protein [Amycolatopsis thailandensis]OXM53703.1 hypothetical protein CFP71_21040 [Amycolatopsis thailandensis]